MMPKRLIIDFENCADPQRALLRVHRALPIYYQTSPKNDRRLKVRFEANGEMLIYNNPKDLTIFTPVKE